MEGGYRKNQQYKPNTGLTHDVTLSAQIRQIQTKFFSLFFLMLQFSGKSTIEYTCASCLITVIIPVYLKI